MGDPQVSQPHANPAFTVTVLRTLINEARKRGVEVLHVDDLEHAIAAIEARRV